MEPIALLLVDDHPMVRRGLRRELERAMGLVVIAEAGSVREAVSLCARKAGQARPRVAVVDLQLPDGSGIQACRQMMADCPETAVLILTAFNWDVYLARAWEAGAAGFIVKAADTSELAQAIRQAAQGWRLWTPEQEQRVRAWQAEVGDRLAALSPREWEVLRLVVSGKRNWDIAASLRLSVSTVEKHVGSLLQKLQVDSRQALMAFAQQHHLEL